MSVHLAMKIQDTIVPAGWVSRLSALCLLSASLAGAQTIPPSTASTRPAEAGDVLELSPFEVRTDRDTGWVASSTLAANRTNTELINVAATVDAITPEFMKDLGVYRLEDIAQFVANVDVVSENETAAEEQRVNFRGMQLGGRENAQSSRNFFQWYTPTDGYNVERIDFSKGSNSLIYGDSIPGGQANAYTKRARFNNSGEVSALYGSNDTHRFTLDVNRKLNSQLALRLNLVDRDDRSYLDYAHNSLRAGHGAVTYRPFKQTQIRFELEKGRYERVRSTNIVRIRTLSAPGRGFSTANRWYVTSDGEIVSTAAGTTLSANDRAAPGNGAATIVSFMEGQRATVSLMNSTTVASGQTKLFQGMPRETNLRGSEDFLDRPFTNYTAVIEQQIGRLNVELSFNRQDQQQERTDNSLDSIVSVDRAGRPYVESTINSRVFGDHIRIVRGIASYPFEVGRWTKQFLVVSAETMRDELVNFRYNLANFAALPGGTGNIANHQVMMRAYLDDPRFPSREFWRQFRPENLPRTNTFRAGWYNTTTTDLPFIDIRSSRAYAASLAGRYWHDRIHTLVGIRRDEFKRKRITNLPTDALNQFVFLGDEDARPDAYEFDPAYDLSNTSYTGSLVFKLNDATSLYATYAESFRWQPYEDFTGKPLGPVLGETNELGVKTALFDRKLFATFGVYRTDRSNSRYVWNPNNLSAAEMEQLFNPNNLRPGDPGYFVPAPGANDEFRTVPSTERAEGFETTLQFQRIHGVQARLTFAHNKLSVSRDFSLFRQYLDAAIARGSESAALIADAKSILDANSEILAVVGHQRSAENSVNWTFDYQFPRESWLKGTRLAVYGNWRDKFNLALINGVMYRGGATHPVGAYAIYQRKLLGHGTTFRLGVKNIVDLENNSDLRVTNIVAVDAAGVPTNKQYRYLAPITFDLSVTVGF